MLVLAGVLGGYLASIARMPLVVGYIGGGLLVGPSVLGVVDDIGDVAFIGELGIALLLFSIGLEFSFDQFRRLGSKTLAAALLQISVLGAGGYAAAVGLGFSAAAATLISGAIAFSSTALLVRMLSQDPNRGRRDRQWALAIALVQDLVAVPLLVVVPQLGGGATGGELAVDVLIAIGKGLGLVVGVVALGRVVVPIILRSALETQSRELFLLTVFALASGIAIGSFAVGLSIAFGAFLAGLVTAQSPFAARTLHELIPLRDLFAATFFVSIGVLLELSVVRDSWDLFLALLLWGTVGKALVIVFLAWRAGFNPGQALAVGLLLGQVGEFSFLFAEAAEGEIAGEAGPLIVAVAAVSLMGSAVLIRAGPLIERGLVRTCWIGARWEQAPDTEAPVTLRGHTVIAGFGNVGSTVAAALEPRGFEFIAVDSRPEFPAEMRERGIPFVWGDLANPAALDEVGLEHARVLVVTVPDPIVNEAIVSMARERYPRLDIIARAESYQVQERLEEAGATSVMRLDLELGIELARRTLHRYGVPASEARFLLNRLRGDEEDE